MPKMYKEGACPEGAEADEAQVAGLEAAGWSRKAPAATATAAPAVAKAAAPAGGTGAAPAPASGAPAAPGKARSNGC